MKYNLFVKYFGPSIRISSQTLRKEGHTDKLILFIDKGAQYVGQIQIVSRVSTDLQFCNAMKIFAFKITLLLAGWTFYDIDFFQINVYRTCFQFMPFLILSIFYSCHYRDLSPFWFKFISDFSFQLLELKSPFQATCYWYITI